MYRFKLIVWLTALPALIFSQNSNAIIDEIIEDFFLDGQIELEESNVADIYENLIHFYQNPKNINELDIEFFESTELLNEIQINAFLDYKNEFGPFMAVEELQAIDGFTLDVISRLKPFVSTKEDKNFQLSLGDMLKKSESTLYLKWQRVLEEQRGYNADVNNAYLGDPNKYTLRYYNRFENKFRIGFIAEKDSGEEFFKGSNKQGFDYYSGHIYLRDYKYWLKDVVVGDYTISLAQGLVMHNDFGTGKSSFVHNIKKGGRVIRPYASVAENRFFRGVASTFKIKDFEITPFASRAKKDGSLRQADTLENEVFFNGILEAGLHRTESEISKKDTVQESVIGLTAQIAKNKLKIGFYSVYFKYDATIQSSDQLYNKFRFTGDKVFYKGLDINYRISNISLFGEISHANNSLAYMTGAQFALSPKAALSVVYRDYDQGFPSLYSNPFGESLQTRNEKGLYTSFSLNLSNNWSIAAFVDTWSFPWLRFQVDKPSTGFEYLARLNYRKKRTYSFYLQYRYEKKQENAPNDDLALRPVLDRERRYLRFHINYKLNKSVELRNRVEFSFFDHFDQSERGFLAYQDIIIRPAESRWKLSARFSVFDTDGFDSRIFTYENDLLYEFFIPAFANRGSRFYTNLRYELDRHIMIEGRYERTYLNNRNSFGSGLELIEGNSRSRVKMQMKIKF